MHETVNRSAGYGGDAAEEQRLLAGRKSGLQIGDLALEDLSGLRVVVQLQSKGAVADGDDPAEKLHTVVLLKSDPVVDAPLEHFDVDCARIERFRLGKGERWG